MSPTKRSITTTVLALPLLLAAAPTVSLACGYHDPLVLAQGMLSWSYPNALHVTGAVWSAQQEGVLAMPDGARIVARGPERERLEKQAYWEVTRALHALSDAFAGAGPDLALVLIEPMLWTRFVTTDTGIEVHGHLSGAEKDDLVIITEEPVLLAVDDGALSIAKAYEMGLVRLYGTPEQAQAFLEACGTVGTEPLPEITQRDLLRRIRQRQMPSSTGDTGNETNGAGEAPATRP